MDTWNRLAHVVTHHAGSKHAFGVTLALVLVLAGVGIAAGPSRAWELAVTCGVPILTDTWAGLDEFFAPGDEILTAASTEEAMAALAVPHEELARIARAARERTLEEHTSDRRAEELVRAVEAVDGALAMEV